MNQTASTSPRPPLKSAHGMASLIAEVTGCEVGKALQRLRDEYHNPGSTVAGAFRLRGLQPYIYSDGLERFYEQSDAFLYESAVWNRNHIKRGMRRWIDRRLAAFGKQLGRSLDVLCIGDGLGFDSAQFAASGHNVTYSEVPGPHERFARAVFDQAGVTVHVELDHDALQEASFDAVVCLDVLEHVPDAPAFVKALEAYLKPGGRLFVHAPFYMIHPAYPTHLRANRIHSGSTRLYRDAGLSLVDGRPFWNPLVFAREDDAASAGPSLRRAMIHLAGCYLWLGRFTALPMRPIHLYRRVRGRWFG